MSSSLFINGHYAASRTPNSLEYLERFTSSTEGFPEQLAPDLNTHLREAGALVRMYQETGIINNLDSAAEIIHRASSKMPDDAPHLAFILSQHETVMDMRLVGTGEVYGLKLDLAVKVAERAVLVTPPDHHCRAARLSYLSTWLGRRFDWHRYLVDIEQAIQKAELATEASTVDDSSQAGIWNNLGYWLLRKFDHLRELKDLNRAVEVSEKAVRLTPAGDPLLAVRQNNLAVRRLRRFQEGGLRGLRSDITRAIEVADLAVTAPGVLEDDKSLLLANLGNIYLARFEKAGRPSRNDIDQATRYFGEAVEEASLKGHPNHADWQLHLGDCIKKRYNIQGGGQPKGIEDSLRAFREGLDCPCVLTETRILLAHRAASILAIKGDWVACSSLLGEAVRLLHFVVLPSQSDSARRQMLAKFQGLASEAAMAALEAGEDTYHALNLLETGLSVTNGLMFDLDAFNDVNCPELWEYGFKRDNLDSFLGCLSFPATVATRRLWEGQIANEQVIRNELQLLVPKVRANPRCQTFLQLHSCEDLMSETTEGPMVVLNVTSHRCDAFIIESSGVSTLRLEQLTLDVIKGRGQDLRVPSRIAATLDWLWISAACPILVRLGLKTAVLAKDCPRVFWILPGAASSLPMHAAGHHVAGSTETVIDRAMSSYCSSVKSLIYGRRKESVGFEGPEPDVALLVSMAETAGLDELPFAPMEVAKVEELCHLLGLRPTVQLLPQYSDIRDHFFECKIFHFAGHGLSDPLEPLASCLCLRDWVERPLTVERLMKDFRVYRHSPFLAYLSACSTGAIEDDRLVDEGLHLIGVHQQSGFRHVIGSLSPVSDQHCVDIARVVYETFRMEGITDKSVCLGLHCALRSLRDAAYDAVNGKPEVEIELFRDGRITLAEDPEHPTVRLESVDTFYWVPYVHFGV